MNRILIIGPAGSDKSTLSQKLSTILDFKKILIDTDEAIHENTLFINYICVRYCESF